jgi:hypothetical protein
MKITNIEGSNGVIGSCCVVHFLSVDSKSAEFDKIIKLGPAKNRCERERK